MLFYRNPRTLTSRRACFFRKPTTISLPSSAIPRGWPSERLSALRSVDLGGSILDTTTFATHWTLTDVFKQETAYHAPRFEPGPAQTHHVLRMTCLAGTTRFGSETREINTQYDGAWIRHLQVTMSSRCLIGKAETSVRGAPTGA